MTVRGHGRPLDATGLKRLHREWRRRTERRVALIVDGVQQPYNLGSIVRTAAAYRVEHLWLAGGTPSPTSPGASKTALGTQRYVEWTDVDRGVDAVDAARAGGYRVVAVELTEGAVPMHEIELGEAVCFVVGHEDRGVTAAALAAVDEIAFLPQLGRVGSLNVAVASALVLYEARRREWADTAAGHRADGAADPT
ncbi:MAG: TrmH family RNA methyltransferase [Acidimicrobiia bacterium]